VLQIDGSDQMSLSDPQIGDDGLLTFDWNISNLGDGTYNLIVRVTDELGLEGAAEALPVSIVVEIPDAPPVVEEQPTRIEEEVSQPIEEEASDIANNIGTIGIVIGLLAMMFAVALVIFAIVLVRRRQASSQPAVAGSSADVYADHDATQVIMPAFAAKKAAGAFLEPLENAPDHRGNIPLSGKSVAIGRDAKLVQIVFSDKSVSRLHARIVQKGSGYQLYDEGSASGTYLNFEQLSLEPQPLRENDDVHIGRVHLRFHLAQEVGDDDSTQVMQARPVRSPGAAQPAAASEPIDEDTSTQPYMPLGPQGQSGGQSPGPIDDVDSDDISTQPYMPHSPKK
jgi:pSer/pThr/pTyr-binding forkhead associated (FHA) protein